MLNPDSFCKKGKELIDEIYRSPIVQQYADKVKVYKFICIIRI